MKDFLQTSFAGQQSEERTTNGGESVTPVRSTGAQPGTDQEKGTELEEKEQAKIGDDQVTDLISQVHRKLTVRVTREGPGVGDVLHSVLPDRERDRDRHAKAGRAYNDMVVNQPDKERGSPHIWVFVGKVKAIERILAQKGWRTYPSRAGKDSGTSVEAQKPHELNAWVKVCMRLPNLREDGPPLKSRILFAFEGSISNKWKTQEADGDQRTQYMPFDEAVTTMPGDTSHRRRITIQDRIRHVLLLWGGNIAAGKSSSWKYGETAQANPKAEKGEGKGAMEAMPMAQASEVRCRKAC